MRKFIEDKKKFLDSMAKMSQSSLLVSLCDKLHGVSCIINDYNKIGKNYGKIITFLQSETKWYYKNLCKT